MKICLAGDGWGAVAAFKSLTKLIDNLFILTNDSELIDLIRPNDSLVRSLYDLDVDYIVCAGYKPIIKPDLTDKMNIINIHYSLLPKYRGLHSTVWAILNGEDKLGLTIHLMNQYIDDGPVIYQKEIQYNSQTSTDIMEACNLFIEDNLCTIMSDFINGKIVPIKQDKSQATWVCRRNLDDCIIDFNCSISFLKRFFRALVKPYPLPMIIVRGKRYQVTDYLLIERNYHMKNGYVVNIDNEGVWIKISDGLLIIKSITDMNEHKIENTELFKIGMKLGNVN